LILLRFARFFTTTAILFSCGREADVIVIVFAVGSRFFRGIGDRGGGGDGDAVFIGAVLVIFVTRDVSILKTLEIGFLYNT